MFDGIGSADLRTAQFDPAVQFDQSTPACQCRSCRLGWSGLESAVHSSKCVMAEPPKLSFSNGNISRTLCWRHMGPTPFDSAHTAMKYPESQQYRHAHLSSRSWPVTVFDRVSLVCMCVCVCEPYLIVYLPGVCVCV